MNKDIKEIELIIKKIHSAIWLHERNMFDYDMLVDFKLNDIQWKQLLDYITNLQEENEKLKREEIQKELCESLLDECDAHNKYLQQKIDKAIEYIERLEVNSIGTPYSYTERGKDLLNILKGENNE